MSDGLVPSLVLFFVVVIAAVPWVLPAEASFILPSLLIIAVFVLTIQRKRKLPGISVFAAGLLFDILTAGPMGYWAILFLRTYTIAVQYRIRAGRTEFSALWAVFAGTAILAAAAGWGLASLYFVRIIDWQPMAIGAAAIIAMFPLFAWPIRHTFGITNRRLFSR